MRNAIKLTYFKESGKYYTVASYISELEYFFEIFEEVKGLRQDGKLPGLISGTWDGYILVYSEEHPNAYPGLIVP